MKKTILALLVIVLVLLPVVGCATQSSDGGSPNSVHELWEDPFETESERGVWIPILNGQDTNSEEVPSEEETSEHLEGVRPCPVLSPEGFRRER